MFKETHPIIGTRDVRDTTWGPREFSLYDLDRNALAFYRHLTATEKGQGTGG